MSVTRVGPSSVVPRSVVTLVVRHPRCVSDHSAALRATDAPLSPCPDLRAPDAPLTPRARRLRFSAPTAVGHRRSSAAPVTASPTAPRSAAGRTGATTRETAAPCPLKSSSAHHIPPLPPSRLPSPLPSDPPPFPSDLIPFPSPPSTCRPPRIPTPLLPALW